MEPPNRKKSKPDFVSIMVVDGKVVINDCSENEDSLTLLQLLGALGLKITDKNVSWCG